jgi:hypothetical protein
MMRTENKKKILAMKMSGRQCRSRPHTQLIDQVKRYVERGEGDWRRVDKMQEWADRQMETSM